ncbi:Oligosaccharyltransferase 48 kDa subunit beta-domain-containing protein [Suillus subluteus]|nr:Oligosaccharyltransferase 48 kDa subunit beta-domain-containing protein [Suillus subluteus]
MTTVILFAPETKSYAQDITPQSLIHHSSPTTLLAQSPKPQSPVPVSSSSPILTPGIPPIWFTGAPHAPGSTPMLVPILRAPAESFATDSTSDADSNALVSASKKMAKVSGQGSQMGLLTGFQTNVNLCVVFAGGMKMFSDEYARKELPSEGAPRNALFVKDVAAWVFQEKMKLRIDAVDHHWVGESSAPEMCTTNDEIVYTAHISAYDSRTSTWKPYSSIDDLQLEFTMLDPHIHTSLPAVAGSPGTYQVQFRTPDRHGVFKFVLNWKRKGYSYLKSSTTVPVVLLRHDQYLCFLSAAVAETSKVSGRMSPCHLFPTTYFPPPISRLPMSRPSSITSIAPSIPAPTFTRPVRILFHQHPAVNSMDHIPIRRVCLVQISIYGMAIYLLCPSLHPPTSVSLRLWTLTLINFLRWAEKPLGFRQSMRCDMVKKDFVGHTQLTFVHPHPRQHLLLPRIPSHLLQPLWHLRLRLLPPITAHLETFQDQTHVLCQKASGLQIEREMCQYLEWELNVDSVTLREFEDMVKKDFVDYPSSYHKSLPASSSRFGTYSLQPSYGHRYPLLPKPTFPLPNSSYITPHTLLDRPSPSYSTSMSLASTASPPTPPGMETLWLVSVSALSSPGIPKHEPAPYTLVKRNALVLILSNH